MVKSLLVDIYMSMCQVFLVKVAFVSQEFHSGFTWKVVSLSFTPYASLAVTHGPEALRSSYLGLG